MFSHTHSKQSTPVAIAIALCLLATLQGCNQGSEGPGARGPSAVMNQPPPVETNATRLASASAGTLFFTTDRLTLRIDSLYVETASGRQPLPSFEVSASADAWTEIIRMDDGRSVEVTVTPGGANYAVALSAAPDNDVTGWGLAIEAAPDEYFTGLMEPVIDGPRRDSWAPGITEAMDLRGQSVDLIVEPTTSVYSHYYLSSRGYALAIGGGGPGVYDFAVANPDRVQIDRKGSALDFVVYLSDDPAALVRAHALDAGPPVMPPEWLYGHLRWRNEHTQRDTYYDGTRVAGPFNAEIMEDVLLMQAYRIPNAAIGIDRPYLPVEGGNDGVEIDEQRLPNFEAMVEWLSSKGQRTLLRVAPTLDGEMETRGIALGYLLPDLPRLPDGNHDPLADLSAPAAKTYWQTGVQQLLDLGIAGFKLARRGEDIPDGTQEGLRASIIAVQRAAVIGYPNWGSETCGYNEQLMEQEVCGRWLAFSALTPIMEVGPTRNVAFWNLPREPAYDAELIATWRLYARLHERLRPYSYALAQQAHETGMPIVRPLFLADPAARAAWQNWWTYLYGPDLVVSPVWQKGRREQQVYLPSGERWRDAWNPERIYDGGQTVTVAAEPHQLPLLVRVGSTLDLGDLQREWRDAQTAAGSRPFLAALEREVNVWFSTYVPD